MQLIDKEELTTLVENSEGRCVSIYMPMTREPDKQDENRIRLKNLIREARERLTTQDADLRVPDVQRLLQPAEELLENGRVWANHGTGLAVFLASNFAKSYTLPLDFEELVVIGKRFHLKPLLPLLSNNSRFYILGLSQNEVRLFQATRFSLDEVEVEALPTSMAEALRYEDPEKQLQHHTSRKVSGATNQRGAPVFHGHEVGSEKKDAIRRYFREVDAGLQNVLANEEAPLVLAAVSYLFPLYRQANTYPHLLQEGIPGNPEEAKPEELHQRAWKVVQPLSVEAQSKAAERYRQLAHTNQASNEVAEIVPAAYHGRIDTLFTSLNNQQWGTFDRETGEVALHAEPGPADRDLLDAAAVQTFLNGGTVYAIATDEIPDGSIMAAVFRY